MRGAATAGDPWNRSVDGVDFDGAKSAIVDTVVVVHGLGARRVKVVAHECMGVPSKDCLSAAI